jgi:uncharacterized membrane protein YphA (DoxX/SURF4 family)
MRKILNNPIIHLIARLIVGYIFLTFAASKIAMPEKFANEIGNYGIMPFAILNIFALLLPWIEFFVGLMLILGIRLKANSIISAGLLIIFIAAVASAMMRGLDINCGCSSVNPQHVGFPKIFENTGLTILSLLIAWLPNKKYTLENFILKTYNKSDSTTIQTGTASI